MEDVIIIDMLRREIVQRFYSDSPPEDLVELNFWLTKMDSSIWNQVRKGKLTLKQFGTRILERMDGYKHRFTDLDDIKHRLVPELYRANPVAVQ